MNISNRLSLSQCSAITKIVLNHHIGSYFSYPIEEGDPSFPGYFNIIKTPMDLSTIQNKINSKIYKNSDEWYQDMHLMFENVRKYYGKGAYFTGLAAELQKFFEKKVKQSLAVTSDSYIEDATKLLEKIDMLLNKPPEYYKEGFSINAIPQIDISPKDRFEFAVAASLLTSKSDILAMMQILESNGYTVDRKDDVQSINMNEISDQGMKELIAYAKQRFKVSGAPYPKQGDTF